MTWTAFAILAMFLSFDPPFQNDSLLHLFLENARIPSLLLPSQLSTARTVAPSDDTDDDNDDDGDDDDDDKGSHQKKANFRKKS